MVRLKWRRESDPYAGINGRGSYRHISVPERGLTITVTSEMARSRRSWRWQAVQDEVVVCTAAVGAIRTMREARAAAEFWYNTQWRDA